MQKQLQWVLEILDRLHADDVLVTVLVEIRLEIINNKELEAHKGRIKKLFGEAIEFSQCN